MRCLQYVRFFDFTHQGKELSSLANLLVLLATRLKSITVSPTVDSLYTCTDSYGCIIDSFTVKVTPLPSGMESLPLPVENIKSLKVYPVPVAKGELLHITTTKIEALDFVLVNISGQTVKRLKVQGNADINTSDLSPGLYILRVVGGGPNDFRKIMVMDRR